MSEHITWRDSLEAARAESKQSGKPVLIELFSPECTGCMTMEKKTFSQPEVQSYIADNFIPVHFNILEDEDAMQRFTASWTPTLIVQSDEGREQRRSTGYLPPQQFVGEMALALVQEALTSEEFETAHARAQDAVQRTDGDATRHPEASYWEAVTAYKASHDQDKLIAGWKQLLAEQLHSDWAKRVEFAKDF